MKNSLRYLHHSAWISSQRQWPLQKTEPESLLISSKRRQFLWIEMTSKQKDAKIWTEKTSNWIPSQMKRLWAGIWKVILTQSTERDQRTHSGIWEGSRKWITFNQRWDKEKSDWKSEDLSSNEKSSSGNWIELIVAENDLFWRKLSRRILKGEMTKMTMKRRNALTAYICLHLNETLSALSTSWFIPLFTFEWNPISLTNLLIYLSFNHTC